jgi:uncharacterized coiled-coil protein SlyX
MPVRNSGFEARLASLEAYVDMPKEPRVTLTARLDAQHRMLGALSENVSDLGRRMTRVEARLTGVEERVTRVEERLTGVEGRLTSVEGRLTRVEVRLEQIEGTIGVILHGVTAIKNMLRPPDDPDDGPALNGSPILN